MESPESYLPLPETFPYEIYSLDESIHPSRDTTSDQSMIDCLTSCYQPGKEELERHRLDNPGVSPDQQGSRPPRPPPARRSQIENRTSLASSSPIVREKALIPNRIPSDSMKSPRSYLPQTSAHEIFSLDGFIDPSTSDQDMIDRLSSFHNQPTKEMLERHRLDKPGASPKQLPEFLLITRRWALMAEEAEEAKIRELKEQLIELLSGFTNPYGAGEWSKKTMETVRSGFQADSPDSTRCVGTKTALEFIPTGAKKAVLGMTQYNMLRPSENGDGLHLDEDLSLCHVFPLKPNKPNGKRKRSECAADQCKDFDPPPLCELKQEISKVDVTKDWPLGVDDYGVDVPVRPWDNYTKIYTEDPELIYAACNHCNTMLTLKGGAGCGTKSLINHSKALKCKKKQQQPSNTSLMHVPSIALDGHQGITTDGVLEITGIPVEIGEP